MERKAAALGIGDRVIFTGIRGDVPDLMQAMDCFVFPSLYEGIPVTLIEAQAAGLPCVVSDGVPEESRKISLFDRMALKLGPKAWAEAVLERRGVSRPDTRREMAGAGYDIVSGARWLQNYYLDEWKREE